MTYSFVFGIAPPPGGHPAPVVAWVVVGVAVVSVLAFFAMRAYRGRGR